MAVSATQLPYGTRLRPLDAHADERGVFTELYRAEWEAGIEPVQWNAVRSEAGVIPGVHVHVRHHDYLTVPVGHASVGLRDLRRGSPSEDLATVVELRQDEPAALVIPRGVAHGFFHEPSLHVYAVSEYWDSSDELRCRWDDPDLEIPWPVATARMSDRDRDAQTLADLLAEL